MADEIQGRPAEESKKDTVRINLPPGLAGRGPTPGGQMPPPGAKIVPTPTPASSPEEEAKKETAVLGRPVDAPKPKKDTSRVQVVAARPSTPSIKLHRDEPAPAPAPASATASASAGSAPSHAVMTSAPSGGDLGLSMAAMVLSIAVAGYLAWIVFG